VDDVKADVLIVGSRGMGAFKRLFLGSVSDYLVHHCKCPVIIAHMPEKKEKEEVEKK
jgi:nucleotide-binding universal stress UspA family protein